MHKVFGVLWAAGAAALLLAQPIWAASDPSQLVKSVTAQVIDIVKTKTGAPREAAFREVLRNSFDLPYMGRQALGTHWDEASAQQRARFLAALETAEARAYSERLGKLEWEVHDNGQGPRIADVKVAGVSMSLTKRSEFNSYIQNNGGTVE